MPAWTIESRDGCSDIWRFSGTEKADIALEMSEGIRSVMVDRIEARLPGLEESGVHRELIRLLHGETLASAIFDQIGSGPPTDPGSGERK